MDKMELKAQILNVCKQIQQETIDHLSLTVDDAQKSANDYGCPRDRYDAYRAQLLRQRDMFAQQLQKAREQMDVLDRISSDILLKQVEFGAVVQTDKNKIFVSIGLGKIKVPESNTATVEEYYAISPVVPIYKAMEGKRVGDTFAFNSQEFTVLEVF